MRITLNELRQAGTGPVELLEILSIEGQRYMARLSLVGRVQVLVLSDEKGLTQLFRSSWELQDALRDLTIERTEVVHGSAYNEMVGMDPAPVDPLRIELSRQRS